MENIIKSLTPIGNIGDYYEILLELSSETGEGKVFLVKEKNTDNTGNYYAAKIPKNKYKSLDNEIHILTILKNNNCQNIANIIDSGESEIIINGQLQEMKQYLILEFVPKRDLFEYCQFSGGFGEDFCKVIFYKIVKSVESIHNFGICHRDIKVDNILFDADFGIKINDFGHAKEYEPLLEGICGTKKYQAPEIKESKQYDGYKIDIFSLGVTLFALTVGNHGFDSASKDNEYYQFIYDRNEEGYWKKYNEKISSMELSDKFKKLYLSMVDPEPKERPTIRRILENDWFGKIRNMDDDQLKEYENEIGLNEELLKRYDKIIKSIVETVENKKADKQPTKGIDGEKEGIFNQFATPEYIETISFMNYYIKLIGFPDPIKFMNDLFEIINQKFGNNKCYVKKDENNKLKLELLFKGDENSEYNPMTMEIVLYKTKKEYLLRFMRKEISKYDFIEKFKIISDLVKLI